MIDPRIDLKKPMRFYIMEESNGCLTEAGILVDIPSENWTSLLKCLSFVKMLNNELESLANDPDGNELLTAFLPLSEGRILLDECLLSQKDTTLLREKINEVIYAPEIDDITNLFIGIDLYKIKKGS